MRALPVIALLVAAAFPAVAQHPFATGGSYDPAVPAPSSVIGHEVGDRFTPHHMLMRYLDRLAATSRRIRLDTVAHSFEGREVMLVTATSERNHARLDEIRRNAARLADPRTSSPADIDAIARTMPVIVWLGFTVHGPEASGAEAAIALLYQLAAGQDPQTLMLLDSAVVLIDPLQNPDGHERHVQDVMRMRTALGVPVHPAARIHSGTWPGPRTSHYHFDMNRDWYAQSHPETRGRVATMLRWWPHVAVDLHEMGSNSTYFFPPPMAPVNQLVHPNIVRWWDTFAAANIAAFDANGWPFFRREGYDEFYPGYGSAWPLYTGAVGMTYEQASSRGGAIMRSDGTVLTLSQAARQHYTAAWATAMEAARRRAERVRDYLAYRRGAVAENRRVRAVVIERDAAGRADSLAAKLVQNGVEVKRLRSRTTLRGATEYGATRAVSATVEAGAYVVDFAQPQGRLAQVLLEPDPPLDSTFIREELARRRAGQSDRFYDMTAWALPFAFRARAWEVATVPTGLEAFRPAPAVAASSLPDGARYGYAFAPGTEAGARLLAALLGDSIRVRYAPHEFGAGGRRFPQGAFVVQGTGPDSARILANVRRHVTASGAEVVPIGSAAADRGTDLGSNSVFPLKTPRVALLGGPPVAGQSFGYAWYALDQRLRYPSTAIDVDAVISGALEDFDVLIVPSVSASAMTRALGDGGKERLTSWVRAGGVLITIDGATTWLASESLGLSRLRARRDTTRADSTAGAPLPAEVPGAIVRAVIDTLSPLTAGIAEREIPVQFFSDRIYTAPRDVRAAEVAIRYAPLGRLRLAGYMWPEVPERLAESPYLWTERVGRGRVIAFTADPNFRDLWRGLGPLFANAVLMGASF